MKRLIFAGLSETEELPVDFSVRGSSVLLCMEICKELRYNPEVGRTHQI